jgi:hypothetical protein
MPKIRLFRASIASIFIVCLLLASSESALAQAPPWTGVVADEARPAGTSTSGGQMWTVQNALSGDGRFMAFTTERALLPDDTNLQMDVYLRDRHTGELTRVSLLSTGEQSDNASHSASISRDGRFVVFTSCGTNLAAPVGGFSCEIYVHHRGQATTTLISRGPGGESQTSYNMGPPAISADGRFVLFSGNFEAQPNYNYKYFFVRDRDGDGDGTFDEPGESTTTQISGLAVGDESITWTAWSAISGDGRWVAYTAVTYDYTATHIGTRLFLHDRGNGTTVRVDQPAIANYGQSSFPTFSDTGELVYVTSVSHLVPGDTDPYSMDLFVVDLATLAHSRISRQAGDYEWYPAISANGAYVVYQSDQEVIAFDRAAGTWQTVNLHPDGAVDQGWVSGGFPSINADGSAIAFMGTSEMLVDGNGLGHNGIFVATAVDLSPSDISAPGSAGSYSFDIAVPENVAWTLDFSDETGIETVAPVSGSGPATVDVSLRENLSGAGRDHIIALGSKKVTIQQAAGTGDDVVTPSSGPVDGGTEVTILGHGFADGAVVTFGGAYAASVTWVSATEIVAVTPPHTAPQWVTVLVTNPDEEVFTFTDAFRYADVTAPEITPTIVGTEGSNGWYVSDVQLTWTVTDAESAVKLETCEDRLFTNDTWYDARCAAESDGGAAETSVQVKIDRYAPSVVIESPEWRTYQVGESAAITFSCDDSLSGVASCSGSQEGALDTSTPGTFEFTATAVDEAGNTVTESVTYTVGRLTPVITWTDPSAVSYPSGLGGSQLNATADVPGTFSYSPAAGTILDAGYHALTVTFTPTDQNAYEQATASVYFEVMPGTVTITWPASDDITYGTPLGPIQLNATHNALEGQLDYFQPAGTLLDAGTHTLTVMYVPESNYDYAFAEKTITVLKANPTLTWSSPSSIIYGVGLNATQLNATANVAGTFQYSPAAGTVLNAGTHTLNVTFNPADAQNYNAAATSVTIVVITATPAVTWLNPAAITYGTALGSTQLNATANIEGTFDYSPAPGTHLSAGTHTLTATFTPSDANYTAVARDVSIVVTKATPVVSWPGPAGITYGTALGPTQLNAAASTDGTFAYSPASGTVLDAGTHTLFVTFSPADASNYHPATASQSVVVTPQALTVAATNAGKVFGEALPAFSVTSSGLVNGDTIASLAGTLSFSTTATATSAPGSYSVSPSGLTSPNYAITFLAGTLTISKANTTVTLATSPSPSHNNQSVTMTAAVTVVAPGSGMPTGVVEFRNNGVLLGTANLVNGVATLNKSFKRGSHPLTATFVETANFNGSTGSKTHQVN